MQFSSLIHVLDQFLIDTHRACSAQVFQFSLPPNPSLGDVCINIFGAVKATRVPPPVLSQEVLDVFLKQSYVTGGNIQGGFVNLFVTDDFFRQELRGYHLPVFTPRSETVIVDYIGANIGKPLHIGHLCTPLFGQAIINLLRRMGYAVIGDMHQGDWGGIFGKLITGWKYFGDTAKFESGPVSHLLEIYVKITEEIEQEDNVDQECRDAFRLLSEGDEASVRLWQQFTDKSLAAVRMIMGEFGVHPDIWVGESFYE